MQLKNLGNSITAINELQKIFDGIKNISRINESEIEALQKATSGYSKELLITAINQKAFTAEQARAILTAKGVEAAEIEEIITLAGLTTAQKSSTVAVDLNTMSKIGNTAATKAQISEETKNLLVKGNLVTAEQLQTKATVDVTKAKIMDAIATGNLTKAEGEQLISTLGLTGATGGLSTAFKGLGAKIKATTASMWAFLTTTPAGWATLAVTAIGSVVTGVYAYNKAIDKAVDNAKENLSEITSEYDEATNAIKENNDKIKELETLRDAGNLSIVDNEDLTKLREQNEELRIRQQYLEKQKEISNQEIVVASKKKYNRDYGRQDTSNINAYKEELSNPTPINNASSYLTGEDGSQYQSSSYAAGQQDALNAENDTLAALIAQYQYYEEEKTKAVQAEDSESIEKYSSKLSEISQKLMESRTELQGFHDDLSLTGESSSELEDVNSKLKLIDNTLLSKGKQLVEFINAESFSTQKAQLVELADVGKLTLDTLTNNFPELDSYLEKNGLTLEDLIGIVKTYRKELESLSSNEMPSLSISDTISKLNTELKPAFDSLKSAYQQIFTIEDGKEIFSIENLDLSALTDLQEKFNDVSGFDTFLRTVTNLSSTSDMVHDAFDNLAASFLYSQDTLENLNESTAGAVIQQLNLLGVNNSQELVTETLTAKTEALALQKQILATEAAALSHNIDFNIISFLDEAGASDLTRQTLFKLIAAEQAFNNQELSTEGKIEKLNELATAYGNTAVQSMTASAMVQMEHNGNFDIDKALADIQDAVNEINGVQIDFKGNSNKSPSSKSSPSINTDTWLEAYKEELVELEHIHDMEEITDREFYERLRGLNENYFNDTSEHHEKYLDEYRSNEEKVAKGLKDAWTKYWEDYKSDLDKASSYADRVLSRQIDSLKAKQENEIDGYDKETDAIDNKIDALEHEKDAVEKTYQKQIDAIQDQIDSYNDEIDKLKEVNEEKNRQLQLEQDIYELERLKNQKTQKEYVEGKGTVYKADSAAIRDQEQQVENDRLEIKIAGYEELINGLEFQQDALKTKMDDIILSIDTQIEKLNNQKDGIQDKIDAINQGYEAQIEALEKYRDKWSEVSDYQAMLEEDSLARKILGADAEKKIVEMREGILNDYIGRYQIANDNLTEISNAGLHNVDGILAQMQTSADTVRLLSGGLQGSFTNFQAAFSAFNSAANTVDTAGIKENLSTVGTVADNTREQIGNITAKLNDLAAEVSSFTLPPLNMEQFNISLGTTEDEAGILGRLKIFTERFRELCSSVPNIWNESLNAISGAGLVSGEGMDYNTLFLPLLAAMDNCKFQMDTKLAQYVTAWTDFNMDLGAVIGIGGDSGTSSGGNDIKSVKDARKPKGGNKKSGDISPDSIVGTIQNGGNLINSVFDDTWIPGFETMGNQINKICGKVVACVNEMASDTVDACRKTINAINLANAAKDSSGSNNRKPDAFNGTDYIGQSFKKEGEGLARGTLPLKQSLNNVLVGELGAEIIANTETGKYRIVGRNGAELTNLNKGDMVLNHTQTKNALSNSSGSFNKENILSDLVKIDMAKHTKELQAKSPETLSVNPTGLNLKRKPDIEPAYKIQEGFRGLRKQLEDNIMLRGLTTTPVVQDITITLPNVKEKSDAQYLINTLKRLPLDTIQYTHKH